MGKQPKPRKKGKSNPSGNLSSEIPKTTPPYLPHPKKPSGKKGIIIFSSLVFLALLLGGGKWVFKQVEGYLPRFSKPKPDLSKLSVSTSDVFPPTSQQAELFHENGKLTHHQSPFEYYRTVFKEGWFTRNEQEETWIILREFKFLARSEEYLLVVNPQSLETLIILKPTDLESEETTFDEQKTTVYGKLLDTYSSLQAPMQNAGVKHSINPQAQYPVLTVDLCPSIHPFDKNVFDRLIEMGRQLGKPTPVTVCVSGLWMRKHRPNLDWLKQCTQNKELDITWVNHSYTHPYYESKPINQNFLLSAGVNFQEEVLSTEQAMIEEGLTPSIFFRFPGLVSDPSDLEQLKKWGLIPLGSDAWLAKGQKPQAGSIILIHGNGNEPLGVHLLFRYFNQTDIKSFNGLLESLAGTNQNDSSKS